MQQEPDERLRQAADRFASQVKDVSELIQNYGRAWCRAAELIKRISAPRLRIKTRVIFAT
ncbi:hypothetical protein JCM10914_5390 [Paenibacillus sp. JCM 10914]|nr:hypothetical protein JCM10914_5390 [Paenibacillus sp. JCM 10914]